MKKLWIILILAPITLFSKVHYAKVEPYDSVVLKSSVSGLVISSEVQLEGREV